MADDAEKTVQAADEEKATVQPAEFDELAAEAREMGFRAVAAAPLVRSSYHAADMLKAPPA